MPQKTVTVMRKKWVIEEVAPNTEIGSDETTFKVVKGPINVSGYWFSIKATKKNIRKAYKAYLDEKESRLPKNSPTPGTPDPSPGLGML